MADLDPAPLAWLDAARNRVRVGYQMRPNWIVVATFRRIEGSLDLVDLTISMGTLPADAHLRSTDPLRAEAPGAYLADARYLDPERQMEDLPPVTQPRSLQARMLREVPMEALRAVAERQLPDFVSFGEHLRLSGAPEPAWRHLVDLDPDDENLSADRLGYLMAAYQWAGRSLTASNPRLAVRTELGLTEQQFTERLRWARQLGYLTSPGRGRTGGDLTAKGAALVARYFGGKS